LPIVTDKHQTLEYQTLKKERCPEDELTALEQQQKFYEHFFDAKDRFCFLGDIDTSNRRPQAAFTATDDITGTNLILPVEWGLECRMEIAVRFNGVSSDDDIERLRQIAQADKRLSRLGYTGHYTKTGGPAHNLPAFQYQVPITNGEDLGKILGALRQTFPINDS